MFLSILLRWTHTIAPFPKLNERSTSILSVLSWYSCFCLLPRFFLAFQVSALTTRCHVPYSSVCFPASGRSDPQEPSLGRAGTFLKAFHGFPQTAAFIIIFKRKPFYPGIAFRVQAEVKFYAELHRRLCFPTHNWTYPWLMETHDPLFHRVHFVVIHLLLLFVQFKNSQNELYFCRFWRVSIFHEAF